MSDEILSSNYLESGSIYFTGLGNGTDFDSMITQLVEIEKRKSQQLEAWKAEWEAKNEGFRELNTSLLSLKTTMQTMDTQSEFLVKTVSSTNESVLTAEAGSEALTGTNSIEINQLAQNDVLVGTTGFTNSSDSVTAADAVFAFTYDGRTVSVDVSAGTTLEGLASMINAEGDNYDAGGEQLVRASVVNDGSNYYLQLRGMDQGADYDIAVDATTTLTGFESTDFDRTQSAQNAQIRVDGWPSSSWLERSTNVIDDVITGITLNLKDTGTVRINTETDLDSIREEIETFVTQYNEVMSQIQDLTKVNRTTGEASLLTGNYGLQMISRNLKDIIASKAVGFDYDEDTFVSLGSLGITTDTEENSPTFGLLTIDWDILDSALKADPEAVSEVFSADLLPAVDSTDFRYYSVITGVTEPGEYRVQYDVGTGSPPVTNASIDGYAASVSEESGEYVITATQGPAKGLAVKVNNMTTGSYDGTIRLKSGKAQELVSELKILTDSEDGTLNILEKNYLDIIDSIDEKLEYEAKRLERYERDLRERYANLEAVLGTYQNIQAQLESQIAQLDSD